METILTALAIPLAWGMGMRELIFIATILAIPAAIVVVLVRGLGGKVNTPAAAKDEHMLHEMSEGLERMEQRIDALETLLADEKTKETHK